MACDKGGLVLGFTEQTPGEKTGLSWQGGLQVCLHVCVYVFMHAELKNTPKSLCFESLRRNGILTD